MPIGKRLAFDTNVLVSRLIVPESTRAKAVRRGILEGLVLFPEATMNELADVLSRPKFDRYVSLSDRKRFISDLCDIAEFVPLKKP